MLLTILMMATSVQAAPPWMPTCGESYFSDSYGLGAKAAFSQTAPAMPRVYDAQCFELGLEKGREVRARGEFRCDEAFWQGHAQGLAFEGGGGLSCFSLGLEAGMATLGIAAREGDVAVAGTCVAAYQAGRRDFRANQANDGSRYSNDRDQHCYSLGWFEGPLSF